MTINAIITGQLTRDGEVKQSAKGTNYGVLMVRTGDQFARINVFGDDHGQVSSLKRGDTVSATGKLDVGVWEGKDGKPAASISMMANRLITPSA